MIETTRMREPAGELSACPFCGKDDRLRVVPYTADDDGGEPFKWGFTVQCSAMGFDHDPRRGCGSCGGWGETIEEAIAAWNVRVVLDELDASKARIAEVATFEHEIWASVRDRLASLTIGTCSCDTMTPELKHHSEACRFRVAMEALDLMPSLEPAPPPHGDAK
jgi:hypothetical protein